MNISELISNAISDNSDLPDGYERTDSLEVIPEMGHDFWASEITATVKESSNGNPSILVTFADDDAPGIAHFANYTFSDSTVGTRITVERLQALGVPIELILEGDLEAIAANILTIKSMSAYVNMHESGNNGRVFVKYEFAKIKRFEVVAASDALEQFADVG